MFSSVNPANANPSPAPAARPSPAATRSGGYCSVCGADAPTSYVSFQHNIGLIIARIHGSQSGEMCGPCMDQAFGYQLLINGLLGWWSITSLIFTPIFLIWNTASYAASRPQLRLGS
jgi:hypothetical protein